MIRKGPETTHRGRRRMARIKRKGPGEHAKEADKTKDGRDASGKHGYVLEGKVKEKSTGR